MKKPKTANLRVTLEMKVPAEKMQKKDLRTLKLPNAVIEILKAPIPNTRIPGARKGSPVMMRQILQYVGAVKVHTELLKKQKTAIKKKKRTLKKLAGKIDW